MAEGSLPLSAARMTITLQGHLRAAELPSHCMMRFFHVGGLFGKSVAATAVDAIIKLGGWKTELMANHCIGVTPSGRPLGSERKRGQSYAAAT